MFNKYKIECTLTVVTGLHIGDSNGFAPIGAMDNPVVRDAYSGDPYIPGSSLKGKMRTLLAKSMQPEGEYVLPTCNNDNERIQRLFGSPSGKNGNPIPARLLFSDAFLSNKEELKRLGGTTEAKYENSINRVTSVANPRPLERVIRGAKYTIIWQYSCDKDEDIERDMKTLADGCKLLSMDYLGGYGSRGCGRVKFDGFKVTQIYPEKAEAPQLEKLFEDVKDYAAQDL